MDGHGKPAGPTATSSPLSAFLRTHIVDTTNSGAAPSLVSTESDLQPYSSFSPPSLLPVANPPNTAATTFTSSREQDNDLQSGHLFKYSDALTSSHNYHRKNIAENSGYSSYRTSSAPLQYHESLPFTRVDHNRSMEGPASHGKSAQQPPRTAANTSEARQYVPELSNIGLSPTQEASNHTVIDTPRRTAKMQNFICLEPLCKATFSRWDYLVNHMRNIHVELWQEGRRTVCCYRECDMKCFDDRDRYFEHMQKHQSNPGKSDSSRATRVILGLLVQVAIDLQNAAISLPSSWNEPELRMNLDSGRLTWIPTHNSTTSFKALHYPLGSDSLHHFNACLNDLSVHESQQQKRKREQQERQELEQKQQQKRKPKQNHKGHGQYAITGGTSFISNNVSTTQWSEYGAVREPHRPSDTSTATSSSQDNQGLRVMASTVVCPWDKGETSTLLHTNDDAAEDIFDVYQGPSSHGTRPTQSSAIATAPCSEPNPPRSHVSNVSPTTDYGNDARDYHRYISSNMPFTDQELFSFIDLERWGQDEAYQF